MESEQEFIDWATKELGENVSATKQEYGDQNVVFKLQSSQATYFLKTGKGLENERERLQWIADKQPVPNVLGFTQIGDTSGLLLSAMEGTNLKSAAQSLGPDKVIDILIIALQKFHQTDIKDCPFGESGEGKVLVHGDACLPNFMVNDGKLSGYIDLEDMRIDKREVDLAAGVWSLQYNFGPGLGIPFLSKYGVESPTEEMVQQLHQQYERMMEEWDSK
jgi:aminoglycoside phosphotransferase